MMTILKPTNILHHKPGIVFLHRRTGKVFTKRTFVSLIKKHVKMRFFINSSTRKISDFEKLYLGRTIERKPTHRAFYFSWNHVSREFAESLTAELIIISKSMMRTIPGSDIQKSHESSCEFAKDDSCNCWCNGEYHGIGRVF